MYAGLTGMCFLMLFAVIFWSTSRFMRHQIDDSISDEISEIVGDPAAGSPVGMQRAVEGMTRHPSGFTYLLQDPQGTRLAGNIAALAPVVGVREWTLLRGRGVRVAGGGYLFVGWSTSQLHEMEEFIAAAFLWGLAASVVLSLAGGIIMSNRLMRRIEAVGETSRDIIDGDLSRRVPVQRRRDELDQLALNINAMLDRIEALMNDLRQVTTNIAHDLRTPLTRLRNRLEFAQRSNADADSLRDILSGARAETDVILEVFGALLRIAQIESGARRAGFAGVDLVEVLDAVIELYGPSIDDKRQCLQRNVEGPLLIQGDRELLTQLFANLMENATRHSPAGARIEVAGRRVADRVEVGIADNGPGVPDTMRNKVLQRFFRLESSRTTAGSGLGLSLAAAVANLHDSSLELSDNLPGLRVSLVFHCRTTMNAA